MVEEFLKNDKKKLMKWNMKETKEESHKNQRINLEECQRNATESERIQKIIISALKNECLNLNSVCRWHLRQMQFLGIVRLWECTIHSVLCSEFSNSQILDRCRYVCQVSCLFNLINWRSVSHKFVHFKNAQKTLNLSVVCQGSRTQMADGSRHSTTLV